MEQKPRETRATTGIGASEAIGEEGGAVLAGISGQVTVEIGESLEYGSGATTTVGDTSCILKEGGGGTDQADS